METKPNIYLQGYLDRVASQKKRCDQAKRAWEKASGAKEKSDLKTKWNEELAILNRAELELEKIQNPLGK